MTTMELNEAKMEAFGDRMMDILNHGALALTTSIGHRSGLFDAMADLPPSTSEEIAAAAGLNERYVREWLGAMVTGGFVEYEPGRKAYYLPPEHAALLTRAASPNNVAAFAQYIPLLGTVEDQVVDCFRNGGGVPYSQFHRFHEVMAEDSGQTVLPALLDEILPLVPGLVDKLKAGIDVLDVGCGAGRALILMARTFPDSRFTGYDFSEQAVDLARNATGQEGLTNLQFEVKDVTRLEAPIQFDLITTFDAVHDQADPASVLAGIHHALKDDGDYLMQDIAGSSHVHKNLDHPAGPFMYTISTMHCMTVSLAQDGAGLGTMWGEELCVEMLGEAGFSRIKVNKLPHDFQNNFYVIRK